MTHVARPTSTVPPAGGARGTSGWVGWVAFAGFAMLLLGGFHVFEGIAALAREEYFVVTSSGRLLDLDYSVWGWAQIAVGAFVALAGVMVLAGKPWARAVGVGLALVSAVGNMALLGHSPLWAVLLIVVDVVVILALTVHGSEIKAGT
ncbi:MAG TPA: hypothetical protein VFR87_00995 [Nocardioidaceae bacterium]|nr:hypothetical protein [Nocardioidaceae bacterium]